MSLNIFSNSDNFYFDPMTAHYHQHTSLSRSPDINLMEIMLKERALEATDKSNTDVYAPKCKEGTRTKIIAGIMDWVEARPTPGLLWFSGPAGGGKTCIMREVAVLCRRAHLPICTYFFSMRGVGLNTERPFMATVVSQLIASIPELKPWILQAISDSPTIFKESLESQMESLVIRPMVTQQSFLGKWIIAIDGFDECVDKRERNHLLRLFQSLIQQSPRPVLIILSSRPEFDITTMLSTPSFTSITSLIQLQEYGGVEDIRAFCRSEFERIRRYHPLKALIPAEWPGKVLLDKLLDKSSGYFLLPAAIFERMETPDRNPVELLEDALSTSSRTGAGYPLPNLDALYAQILHPPETDFSLMKRILHSIMGFAAAGPHDHSCLEPSFLDGFFHVPPDIVETTICDLHSVLSIPTPDSNADIYFYHPSMEDFLLSSERSGDLFQSTYTTQLDLIDTCVKHLQRWSQSPSVITEAHPAYYASQRLNDHLRLFLQALPASDVFPPDVALAFDPKIAWRCSFAVSGRISPVRETYELVHEKMCTNDSCVWLCKMFLHVDGCYGRAHGFIDSMELSDSQARLSALPQFDKEMVGTESEALYLELSQMEYAQREKREDGERAEKEIQGQDPTQAPRKRNLWRRFVTKLAQ